MCAMLISSESHRGIDLSQALPVETWFREMGKAFDPFGMVTSLWNAQAAWLSHPRELARASVSMSGDMLALNAHLVRRFLGLPSDDVIAAHGDDVRFSEPEWTEAATWDILKEWYLAITHRTQDMYFSTPGMTDRERRRAAFWARVWVNAIAPTNFFWLNPVAMKRFVDSKGQSLMQGGKNFVRDFKARNIQMVEPDAFVVGRDLATTPGKVVFRTRMMELIHYAPTTPETYATPLLIVPPWINKFYILDLNPANSMIRYLVSKGLSVFVVSWKNPDASMSDVRFDDYLLEGVHAAVEAVRDFCNVPKVHLTGYCIGGTLVSTYMAWANRRYGKDAMPVMDWTLFTTLTDFSQPGDIDAFIDDGMIDALDESMSEKGYLDGAEMASAFRLLRSNSLIWNYWVRSYLYGEALPPLDVLFWNIDTTRMPRAMHSFYLREMYLHNRLIQPDSLTVADEPIDLGQIEQPLFAVTAFDDHIAPWQQCFRIRQFIHPQAPLHFVLSTSGHILGIVNPPIDPPKRSYWVGEPSLNDSPDGWKTAAPKKPGTWWDEWVAWLVAREEQVTGKPVVMRAAYPVEQEKYPALADAPGTYIFEK